MKRLMVILMSLVLVSGAAAQRRVPQRPVQQRRNPANIEKTVEQMEKQVLAFLQKHHPESVEELNALKSRSPRLYSRRLAKLDKELTQLEQIKAKDPEHYENLVKEKVLGFKSAGLARAYRQSRDESEKAAIKNDLAKLLDELFDYRQENRAREIAILEERVHKLKELQKARQDNKGEIVTKRLDQLLGNSEDLQW